MRALAIIAIAARVAAADPAEPRVLTAPTAWLPGAGTLVGTAGLDHHFAPSLRIDVGLGELAELEVGADSDLRQCSATCLDDPRAGAQLVPRAAFRIGAHQDAWFRGQPAIVLGAKVAIGDPAPLGFAGGGVRIGALYVAASRALGPLRVHAGGELVDAQADGGPALGVRVRPFGGLELTPPQYPKDTLLADLAWVPRFDAAGPVLEWVAGGGFRFQALRWGAIELDVRAREGDGLAGMTVLVRVTGVWDHALRF